MSVLSACAEAAIELNQPEPSSLFSTTDQFAKELRTQANKSARAIAKVYDWQKLLAVHTLTGDGTTTSFVMPSDYSRMKLDAGLLTSGFGQSLNKATDINQWLGFQIGGANASPGRWIILGGTMQVLPAIATGDAVKFYYVKNATVTGGTKTAFTDDGDTFDLSEDLLALSVIWRWRAQKRKDFAEDLQNYNIALAEGIAADKGSRILVVGRQRMPGDARLAYPGVLG